MSLLNVRNLCYLIAVSAYALEVYEGQMYLFGGWDGEKALDVVLRYNPLNDSWFEATAMPTARAFAGATAAGGKVYVIGGWDGKKALNVNESYNPSRDLLNERAWDNEDKLPVGCFACKSKSISDMIFVVAKNEYGSLNLYEFIRRNNEWSILDIQTEILFNDSGSVKDFSHI